MALSCMSLTSLEVSVLLIYPEGSQNIAFFACIFTHKGSLAKVDMW